MRPGLYHRFCAHPVMICWLFGTLALWIPVTVALSREGALPNERSENSTWLLLLLGYASLAGAGLFVGVIPLIGFVNRFCRWMNGGPYDVGDRVTLLTGRHRGATTTVYARTAGQDGNLLARVELGTEAHEKHLDIFDDFTLFRTTAPCGPAPTSREWFTPARVHLIRCASLGLLCGYVGSYAALSWCGGWMVTESGRFPYVERDKAKPK